jgi:hypothetical protein
MVSIGDSHFHRIVEVIHSVSGALWRSKQTNATESKDYRYWVLVIMLSCNHFRASRTADNNGGWVVSHGWRTTLIAARPVGGDPEGPHGHNALPPQPAQGGRNPTLDP